ncbi:MAG: ankyrin repeat domain-containing protein, partial [Elusimicrobiaceae bacterium]|nr:ankyrin repeat domain-containing protein [Elusimicrobiaceae bacterium]
MMKKLNKKIVQSTAFLLAVCMGVSSLSFAGNLPQSQVNQTASNAAYQDGMNPLAIAQVLELEESLGKASFDGNVELVCSLLQRGGIPIEEEAGAFMTAALNGHLEVLKAILSARPNLTRIEGLVPEAFGSAAERGYKDIVEYLLQFVDVDVITTQEGDWTALMRAVTAGKTEIVDLLIEKKADIDKKNGYSMTPLMQAGALGYTEIVRHLMDAGADPNIKMGKAYQGDSATLNVGTTALMLAAFYGQLQVVKILVDEYNPGADVNDADMRRMTALGYCMQGKRMGTSTNGDAIVQYLRSKGLTQERYDAITLKQQSLEMRRFLWGMDGPHNYADLLSACTDGDVDFVDYFFKRYNVYPSYAQQAFFTAVNSGKVELVKHFIEKKWVQPDARYKLLISAFSTESGEQANDQPQDTDPEVDIDPKNIALATTALGEAVLSEKAEVVDFLLQWPSMLEKRIYTDFYRG